MAMINEQAFLDLLTEVQTHHRTMVLTQSYDKSRIIDVDLVNREINLKSSPYNKFISVSEDHYAETLYFRMPRYYDGVDLLQMVLVVEYVNAKGESYIAPIIVKDIASEPGNIIFGWCIHGNASIQAGTLEFAFHLFQIDLTTHELTYSLRTKPASSTVMKSIPSVAAKYESGLLNAYSLDEVLAGIMQNTTLWWNNL